MLGGFRSPCLLVVVGTSEAWVVGSKRSEVYGMVRRIAVALCAGNGLQQAVAHGAQVGQQYVLHVILRVVEHGLEVESRGDDVLQFQCRLVARSLSAEVDIACQSIDEIGSRTDKHVAIGTHILWS